MSQRSTYAYGLLGSEAYRRVRTARILVVGAGGIGCELLKNLVLVGFGNIQIIDLDTIDLSNLNRQFLFRKADIKKSKALVAAAFAKHFNPGPGPVQGGGGNDEDVLKIKGVNINARHGNIKEEENDVRWMQGFDLVLSALDNLGPNRMLRLYGQARSKDFSGVYDPCYTFRADSLHRMGKELSLWVYKRARVNEIWSYADSFPVVCRSKLFGEDDEDSDETELEKAKADGEDANEIDNLKKEAAAFREVRQKMSEIDGARRVFEKVFSEDIKRLLSMEDMWKVEGRVKPVPLDYETIMAGNFTAPPVRATAVNGNKASKENGTAAPKREESKAPADVARSVVGLKDQRELSVKDNLELFIDSCNRLSARAVAHPNIPLSFDKDDDDTLDFVLATANLRAIAYGIPTKTRFEVKQMAGNIIPAIATTNAIIAGFIVMRAINILNNDWTKCTNVFLKADPARPLGSYGTQPPEPSCGVCQDVYVPLPCDPTKLTLGTFVNEIVREWLGWKSNDEGEDMEISVYEDKRLLADPDYEDNFEKTFEALGVNRGKMLTVVDDDGVFANVAFPLCKLSETSEKPYLLPEKAPEVPKKPVQQKLPSPSPPPQIVGQKRPAPEDEEDEEATSKRAKIMDGIPGGDSHQATVQLVYDSDDDIEIL
ncbi:hypothetical protein QFC21_001110 [Naganishia friedmannii]|uniref:Uncharacterized protein n=1 Tax=Naganishia friedmannii TaxID=89922 RepID=A0ACC2W7A8_9TREE|nr:hypothetical protein QFC21_001110 [Naganishia friedmannii]